MPLAPTVAADVAHLVGVHWTQVLSGEVAGAPSGPPRRSAAVARVDRTVPGRHRDIPVRVYAPSDPGTTTPSDSARPALVWAHGGGWRFGSLDMCEADSVAQLAVERVGAVVVSVAYGLVPEHTHPGPVDDLRSVLRWLGDEARSLGVDPSRIALGGASSGAHLALLAALDDTDDARTATGAGTRPRTEAGPGAPTPAAVMALYPVTDPHGGPYPPTRDPDCPEVLWLDHSVIGPMFDAYLGDTPAAAAIPARADLRGLPPVLVATAGCDALAPQARAFAERAGDAGVRVDEHVVEGVLHGYADTVGRCALADRAVADHLDWLAARLAR